MADWWDEKRQRWADAMKAKGHMPVMSDDGGLDVLVYDAGNHNGPGCSVCHWNCCWHCDETDIIPQCTALELQAE